MAFADLMESYKLELSREYAEDFDAIVDAVFESVVNGSPVTGSPGQPKAEGDLIASFRKERTGPDSAEIYSDLLYADDVEEGIGPWGPLQLHSPTGGFHSAALTVANFSDLVDHVVGRA